MDDDQMKLEERETVEEIKCLIPDGYIPPRRSSFESVLESIRQNLTRFYNKLSTLDQ